MKKKIKLLKELFQKKKIEV